MAGIRRNLNDPIVKGSTQFDEPLAGSLTFGPSAPFGGVHGPSGDFGGSTLSGLGGGTFLNIDFEGVSDVFIADLLDLISFLQSDIEKTGNTESTKPFQNALDRWTELLNNYQNGDATLQDLKDFDAGMLGNMPAWNEYFDNFISGEEGVVLGGVESTGEGGDEGVILPPLLPPTPTEDKPTSTTGGDTGGGDTGGGESAKDVSGVLGEDWEYDPEHPWIYVGGCTLVQVDENGNPIGSVEVSVEECELLENAGIGANYSYGEPPDPEVEVEVDIFGEGSIVDTTKDGVGPGPTTESKPTTDDGEDDGPFTTGTGTTNTGPATESKQTDGGDGGSVVTTTTGTTGGTGPATESKQTDGGNGVTTTTGTTGGTGPATESKQTDGGTGPNTEGVITFSNMYGYYNNKDGDGDGNGDGNGDGDGDGFSSGMLTSSSSFTPFQAIPGYTAPTYAPINVPQQDYMAEINTTLNNLIARNSMFKV